MSECKTNREILEDILVNKYSVTKEMCETGIIQLESIEYIDLIVDIEELYDINIPDEFLTPTGKCELTVLIEIINNELKKMDK